MTRPAPMDWTVWRQDAKFGPLSMISDDVHMLIDAAVQAAYAHGRGRYFICSSCGRVRMGLKVSAAAQPRSKT